MLRSINQFIIGTILTLLLISVAEAKNSEHEHNITPSTLAPGSLVNNEQKTDSRGIAVTTTNVPTSHNTPCTGGSISDGNGGCFYADTCEMLYGPCDCFGTSVCCIPGECFIPCGPDSNGSRNRRCSPPETVTTTNVPTSYTTPCPIGFLPDGHGGCYLEETCEMINGPCNCNGNSQCCTHGACTPKTIVPEPTTTAHNKCVKN
jgi:hypothetical protein